MSNKIKFSKIRLKERIRNEREGKREKKRGKIDERNRRGGERKLIIF